MRKFFKFSTLFPIALISLTFCNIPRSVDARCSFFCALNGQKCSSSGECISKDAVVECPGGKSYCKEGEKCVQSELISSLYNCMPASGEYCGLGMYCSHGRKCKKLFSDNEDGCIPANAEECFRGGYCEKGTKCASFWRKGCIPEDFIELPCIDGADVPESTKISCQPGEKCVAGVCIPESATKCGDDDYCLAGEKCSKSRPQKCIPENATECVDGSFCEVGKKCLKHSGGCMPENVTDCLDGVSCPVGQKCPASGGECVPENSTKCKDGNHCIGFNNATNQASNYCLIFVGILSLLYSNYNLKFSF